MFATYDGSFPVTVVSGDALLDNDLDEVRCLCLEGAILDETWNLRVSLSRRHHVTFDKTPYIIPLTLVRVPRKCPCIDTKGPEFLPEVLSSAPQGYVEKVEDQLPLLPVRLSP